MFSSFLFKDLSYSFEKGKMYAIKGKSGSGKTTLLSLISGLEKNYEGEIYYDDKLLSKTNLDIYRNKDIGIVFQSYNLLPHLTAMENIILSMDISKVKVKDKKKKAVELMESVGLSSNLKNRRVLKLSGGEQQRVAIARAVVNLPKILICDEPTGNLDPTISMEIMEILEKINKEYNTTVLMVTHDLDIVKKMKKRTIVIKDGRLVKDYKKGGFGNEKL
jgi:putative ABC transport system ATP-binding protein